MNSTNIRYVKQDDPIENDFFRSHTDSKLPDNGIDDETTDIGRAGSIQIGGLRTSSIPLATGPSVADASLNLGTGGSSQGQLMRNGSPIDYFFGGCRLADNPTTLNTVYIASLTDSSSPAVLACNHRISISYGGSGHSVAKNYIMSWQYNQYPTGVVVQPITDTGQLGTGSTASNFELIAKVGTTKVDYYVRRTFGTDQSGGNRIPMSIHIESHTDYAETLNIPCETITDNAVYPLVTAVPLPATYDFFRTIAGSLLPDGTADTAEDIRRIGDIGIGGTITETIPTIANAPTQSVLNLSNTLANLGQFIRGASPLNYYLQRALPTVVNNTIEIGRMTASSGSFSHLIGIAVSDGGFATAKTFVMAWNYSQGNFVVTPTADGGPYGTNDYELIAKNGAGFVDYLLRRKSGATGGTAQVTICSLTGSDEVFQEKSATGTDATVYNESKPVADFWRSGAGAITLPNGTTDLTESIRRNGLVGLNIDPVQTLDVNGGGYFGTIVSLAIRNASLVAGILNAAGTASIGPAAAAGQAVLNMFVEGVAGTAFNNAAQFRIGRLTTGLAANTILETWLSVGNINTANTKSVGFHALANTGGARLLINSASPGVAGAKVIGVNATGDIVAIDGAPVAQFGTAFTKQWNGSVTGTASSVVFNISAAAFTTIGNIQATAFLTGATAANAPHCTISAQSLTSITVLVTESASGVGESLVNSTISKTVYLTCKGN